jgi:SH3 domain-containing YSC84-like protein 1
VDKRARTHGTRFFCDVKIALVQPPVAERRFGLGDREHLRMRSRIFQQFDLIVGTRDDFAGLDNDGSDRNFTRASGFLGKPQRLSHEIGIGLLLNHQLDDTTGFLGTLRPCDPSVCAERDDLNVMKKLLLVWLVIVLGVGIASAATEQEVVDQSAAIIRRFHRMRETDIPESVLRRARGLAIMSVIKVGFGFSGKGGEGVVVARTRAGWSGPSFVGTGGAGWGLQIGAQLTEFVFVLNTDEAVRAFSRDGNVTIGADVSAAAGPVGRDLQASVAPNAAIYTYSRSKGLFAGASLEGAIIATQRTANARYYGRPVRARDILSGRVAPPPGAAHLRALLSR